MVVPFNMLLRTRVGQSKNVVHATLKIEGVKVSHSVMGNYDVILTEKEKTSKTYDAFATLYLKSMA